MRKTFLTLLGLVFCLSAFSQMLYSRKVIRYSLKNGLSNSFVNGIVQDNQGFLWFATDDGLNRFDGISFKVFKFDTDNPNSLPSNYVQLIFKDAQGGLWISSRQGIYQFDPNTERFKKFCPTGGKSSCLNNVNSIYSSGKDILWFSSGSTGVFSYDKKSNVLKKYNRDNLPELSNNIITNALEDSKGVLWLGTVDGNVFTYQVKNGTIIKNASQEVPSGFIPKGRINSIYEDHRHNMWIATSLGLSFYRRSEKKFYVFTGPKYHLRSNYFYSLMEDSNHNLLIGLQDGGLYKLDLERAEKSDYKDITIEPVKSEDNYNITERSVQALYQDKDKNIWAATYGDGIYMLGNVPENFRKFQRKLTDAYGTSFLRYYGMCRDSEGNLWLGTDGDGIYKTNFEGKTLKHYFSDEKKGSLTDNAILCAATDHAKNLWFGSYAKGLFKYDQRNDRFINYKHQDNNRESLCSNDVRVIFEDSGKNLWVGTNGGGISVLPNGKNGFINYTTQNGSIASNNIRAICEDKKGNLFIGTYASGLIYYVKNQHKFQSYFQESEIDRFLRSRVIYALKYYNDKLLIGTEGNGLVIYDINNQKFKKYTEKDGLANNTINAIQPDEEGNIWLSTNKGLSKIENGTEKIINYDTSNGLQTGQFNPNSVMYSPKEKFICFGGTEGYNIFFPAKIKKERFKPKVIITSLQLFGKNVEVGQKDNILNEAINQAKQITLKPEQSVFSIQYIALNYAYPEKNEFAYQLLGLDKSWNYVGNQRSATYRYLEPGTYTFKIKASNQDGLWFNDYASIKIKILPPWYRTIWAYIIYGFVFTAVVYFYLRYKSNQARLRYDIQIAKMTAEKEKELNEKKLSFFTNISHEFRTPLTLIINPVKELLSGKVESANDLSSLHVVYRNARRLLSLVDQLLLFRKADSETDKLKVVKLNIVNLCKEVFLCFNYQAMAKNIRFEFYSENDKIDLYGDREKLEIVLFNLISNALKFTPGQGNISCSITETAGNVTIKIKDSGCGIAKDAGEQLFDKFYQVQKNGAAQGGFGIGLYLVKMFVKAHQGSIFYDSAPGNGTSFNITLLKGKAHFDQVFIFEDIAETSVFLHELIEDSSSLNKAGDTADENKAANNDSFIPEKKTMLVIEDNLQLRQYLKQIFQDDFEVLVADNGQDGLKMVYELLPSFIISDVIMNGLNGIELCTRIKEDEALNHIPVILLTASSSPEIKLKGIECGADDYITKPFEKEVLVARVNGLLKSKSNLQKYFYNEITLKSNDLKIPADYKEFLGTCINIVGLNLEDKDFTVKHLAAKIGMSHSNLYKKIKLISGHSANEFIRFIRLRKAAEIFVTTDYTISETAHKVGINDPKYFREQFSKLFGLNPSDYIKKFRKPFHESVTRNNRKIKR